MRRRTFGLADLRGRLRPESEAAAALRRQRERLDAIVAHQETVLALARIHREVSRRGVDNPERIG